MFYVIYKITNQIDGKFYVGSHKTKNLDDEYMGSGKYLKHAQEKYGIENFTKEILFVFDNPNDMYKKESEIVNEDFLTSENTYNLKIGGFGGWDFINKAGLNNKVNQCSLGGLLSPGFSGKNHSEQAKQKIGEAKLGNKIWVGKTHKDETKQKMSKSHRERKNHFGEKNSQYGTMWITNGIENKKIKKDEKIPKNWRAGRTVMQWIANP